VIEVGEDALREIGVIVELVENVFGGERQGWLLLMMHGLWHELSGRARKKSPSGGSGD
jgi:hypothetical protein